MLMSRKMLIKIWKIAMGKTVKNCNFVHYSLPNGQSIYKEPVHVNWEGSFNFNYTSEEYLSSMYINLNIL